MNKINVLITELGFFNANTCQLQPLSFTSKLKVNLEEQVLQFLNWPQEAGFKLFFQYFKSLTLHKTDGQFGLNL